MRSRSVFFTAPRRVEVRDEQVTKPGEGEVVVETEVSAVSAGTELLLYRGELREGTPLDESLLSLGGSFRYPVCYGYSAAGRIASVGPGAPEDLEGSRVFAFAPHRSRFRARAQELELVPEGIPLELACFLPTVETALGLVLDARPLVGERVLVVGQGVVGLVTTAVLARFPLGRLWTVDRLGARRELSTRMGAERALPPEELDEKDFDLTVEVSGSPEGLNLAIGAAGFEGRVVVGSWYGEKRTEVALGTHFHRARLSLISSQVSHLGAHLRSRWTRARRLELAWDALPRLPLDSLVSHRFGIESAPEAYRFLDERPEACLQVLLTYT